MTEKKKKPSFFRILFRFILILLVLALLAAAGFAYWLYSRMKSTAVTLDDIPGYLSAQPMDPDERFSAVGSGDLTVALDKSDLWWLIDRLFGMGWEQEAVAALEPYQIEYDGVGLRLEDGSARIDAQAHWKSVVLRASIPLAVSCVDGELRAVPTGVEVGGVPVPEVLLRRFLPVDLSEFAVSYKPETVLMERVETAVPVENGVLLSGPLSPEIFSGLPSYSRFRTLRFQLFMDGYGDALTAQEAYQEEPAQVWAAVASRIGAEPAFLQDFLLHVLALTEEKAVDALGLEYKNYGFFARCFPELGTVSSLREALEPVYAERCELLNAFQDRLEDAYCAKKITVREGQYLYNGEPLTMEALFGEDWAAYEALFGGDPVIPCVVAFPGYSDPRAPTLSQIADGPESFAEEPDMSRRAPLGALVMGRNGSPFLLLRSVSNSLVAGWVVETTNYVVLPVKAETYAAALNAAVVPVVRE